LIIAIAQQHDYYIIYYASCLTAAVLVTMSTATMMKPLVAEY